jgi:hypothetical protein
MFDSCNKGIQFVDIYLAQFPCAFHKSLSLTKLPFLINQYFDQLDSKWNLVMILSIFYILQTIRYLYFAKIMMFFFFVFFFRFLIQFLLFDAINKYIYALFTLYFRYN